MVSHSCISTFEPNFVRDMKRLIKFLSIAISVVLVVWLAYEYGVYVGRAECASMMNMAI